MDKIKTLSAAIRLGATFRPQCFGHTFISVDGTIHSCALGAALEAIKPDWVVERFDNDYVVQMLAERFNVPEKIVETAHEINDGVHSERATREQVATWLEEQGY